VIPDHDKIKSLTPVDLLSLAHQLESSGQVADAIVLYQHWIDSSSSPLKYVAFFNLGVLYNSKQEQNLALEMYEKALEINPELIQARLNLASILEQSGRPGEAVVQWQLALNSKKIAEPNNRQLQLTALNNLQRTQKPYGQYSVSMGVQNSPDNNSSRIIYVSTDDNTPTGGIKVIYKHSELLRQLGYDAYVMHFKEGFRCDWFNNSAAVIYANNLFKTDTVIVPEVLPQVGIQLHNMGIKYVMFVQNGYYVLPSVPLEYLQVCYQNAAAILSISDDTANILKSIFPELSDKIIRIKYSVDVNKFYLGDKVNKVTYMPRKNAQHSSNVVPWLKKLFPEWVFVPLHNMSEEQVAEELRNSKIFLAFSDFEGCPVPPIEAALSGNVVLGYHGWGGREYWVEPNFREVVFGDIRDFVRKFYEVSSFANHPSFQEILKPGIDLLKVNYGLVAEREMLVKFMEFIKGRLKSNEGGAF
jgi:tetratricopeptide (TPR) repeat protein